MDLYPISIPLLSSVRIVEGGGSRRFIELLSDLICEDENYGNIILKIIQCKSIRYKNGKDYVQEEVIPMAMKEIIRNINSNEGQSFCAQKMFVLAKLFSRANLSEIKA